MNTYLRTPIKGQEAEEQNESSEASKRNRMTGHVNRFALLSEPSESRSHEITSNQSTNATQGVNNSRTSKVFVAIGSQPTRALPGPVGDRGIDPAGDEDAVDKISHKGASLGDASRHDGGGCSSKHELEKPSGILFGG